MVTYKLYYVASAWSQRNVLHFSSRQQSPDGDSLFNNEITLSTYMLMADSNKSTDCENKMSTDWYTDTDITIDHYKYVDHR